MDLQGEYGFGLREAFVENETCADSAAARVPFVDIEGADGATVRFDFPVKQAELRRAIHAEMGRQTGEHS